MKDAYFWRDGTASRERLQMAVLPRRLPPVPFTVEEVVKMGRHYAAPWMGREDWNVVEEFWSGRVLPRLGTGPSTG